MKVELAEAMRKIIIKRVSVFLLLFCQGLVSLFGSPAAAMAACYNTSQKFSNLGFETDLSSWTALPKTYSDSSAASASNAVAAWPLDDTTTTQSYARVLNPAVSTGRTVVLNGTFDSDTIWTKGTGWTISGGTGVATTAAAGQNLTQSIASIVAGKVYSATYTVTITSGTMRIGVGSSGNGPNVRSTSGTYTDVVVAGSTGIFYINPVTTLTGTVDDITLTQLSVPAYDATPSTLLTDGNMETSGTADWTAGNSAVLSKQTSTPHGGSQILRVTRASAGSPFAKQTILSVGQVYRVTGYARGDGSGSPSTPFILTNNAGTTLFTGSTSTAWQPFDFVFVATATDIDFGSLSLTANTGYVEFDDVVVSLDTGIRQGELIQDNDMETSGTANWTAGNSATLSKQTTDPHGGSQALRVAYNGVALAQAFQTVTAQGKTYRVTGYARSDGTAVPSVNSLAGAVFTGSASTSWQLIDATYVAGDTSIRFRNTTSSGYVEFDDISVMEIDPLRGVNTNGVTLGSSTGSGGHLTTAYTFDGSNDYVNIYSTDLNSAFNQSEGTLIAWVKVSGSGVWTDGTIRRVALIGLDASTNTIAMSRTATNNQLSFVYIAGGTTESVTASTSSTGWMQMAVTWSKSADQFKAYLNGAQTGATQTGLGTWSANLGSTQAEIGGNAGANNIWSGQINDVRLYNTALTSTQIANLYSGIASTRDTTTKLNGAASSKLVTYEGYNGAFTQSVNVGDANTYELSAYAYTDGSAVTSSDAALYYNGSTITTTYTSVGGGWYRLSGSLVGANESRDYGVYVPADKTVYVDDMSLSTNYETSCSPAAPPVCSDSAPTSAPTITSVSTGATSATINWLPASGTVSYYSLEYGTSPGVYQYSAGNIGGSSARSYTVGSLTSATKYYFRIRAGNGCSTGTWSNEASATTLGVYRSPIIITPTPLPSPKPVSSPTPSSGPQPTSIPEPTGAVFQFPQITLPKISIDISPLFGLVGSTFQLYPAGKGLNGSIVTLASLIGPIEFPTIAWPTITWPTIAFPTIRLPEIKIPYIAIDFRPLFGPIALLTNRNYEGAFTFVKESFDYASFVASTNYVKQKEFFGRVFDWMAFTATTFSEIVLDKEPTVITDVQVVEVSPTSAIIYWKTNHLSTSQVSYGESTDFGKDVVSFERVHDHFLKIEDLEPGVKYYYEVMSQSKDYVYNAHHEFTTPLK